MRIAGPERPVEGASGGAAPADPPRSRGDRRHVLPAAARGPRRRLRRIHAAREEAPPGARSQPQFPGVLAAGIRAAGRRPLSDVGARGARRRRLHRAPSEHHRRHDVPHVERRAAAPVRAPAATRRCTPRTCGSTRRSADKGTELTGYPAISVYHEFRYHPKSVIGGTFDWIYEHLGIFSWVVEIWSPMREAGIEGYKYIDWFRDHPIEDDLQAHPLERHGARRPRARSAGSPSTIRSSARSRSAAGTASTRSRIRRPNSSSAN